ncbi:restriction modification system DNA specificity domain-containing protein [Salinisphaera hydrothermalis C41B8]|uniref:Restriction modification system DNA specificity domain-containing protein n=2 Tax=Salinisphaera TaxID=180541 RepID=A0A084IPL3_SALHC|nr:restriction modification system DNA specificity domain-containing protein [Salinisphaera hydrothermalis C41B8]
MCFPDSVVGFTANADESSEIFMHYVFRYIRNAIQKSVTGSIQDNINIEYLTNLEFKIPKKWYQDKIASVLAALDEKIELNQRINAKLEALAKTIYDYWFVQFDFPDENGRPYKSSGGAMEWNEDLKRNVPKGWKARDISSVADVLGGGTPSKNNNDYWGVGFPFFTPSDAGSDVFRHETEHSITQLGLDRCSTRAFPRGTVFITARGSVGKIVIAGRPMAMNQSCYALRPADLECFPFVYEHAKTLVNYLKVKSTGSIFKSIISSDIHLTPLVEPPDSLVKDFSKKLRPAFERMAAGVAENQKLTQLRDWLLPMLMNGQVRVG